MFRNRIALQFKNCAFHAPSHRALLSPDSEFIFVPSSTERCPGIDVLASILLSLKRFGGSVVLSLGQFSLVMTLIESSSISTQLISAVTYLYDFRFAEQNITEFDKLLLD